MRKNNCQDSERTGRGPRFTGEGRETERIKDGQESFVIDQRDRVRGSRTAEKVVAYGGGKEVVSVMARKEEKEAKGYTVTYL